MFGTEAVAFALRADSREFSSLLADGADTLLGYLSRSTAPVNEAFPGKLCPRHPDVGFH